MAIAEVRVLFQRRFKQRCIAEPLNTQSAISLRRGMLGSVQHSLQLHIRDTKTSANRSQDCPKTWRNLQMGWTTNTVARWRW